MEVPNSIYQMLSEGQEREARIYREAYRAEYERCYDKVKANPEHLALWRQLAHTAGDLARRRLQLATQSGSAPEPELVVERVINGKRYATKGATLLWRSGSGVRLYRTPKGAYFRTDPQQHGGWSLSALEMDEALLLYQIGGPQTQRPVKFEQAFPGLEVEDA